jgi:Bacterial PH domain
MRAVAAYLVLVAAALVWGCFRSWRMTLQMTDRGVTVRNFFGTRRIDWHEVNGFGSDPDMEGISTLNVMLRDGRTVTATATLKAPPGMLAAIRQEAGRRGIQADPAGPGSAHRRRKPRPKWQKWYLLWVLAMMLALTVMGGGNGAV